MGVGAVLAGLTLTWAASGCRNRSGGDQASAEPQWYLHCEGCKRDTPIAADQYDRLFPLRGLDRAPGPVACPACGRTAAKAALKCPKDGAVFIQRNASDLSMEPCPKCGWTLAGGGALR